MTQSCQSHRILFSITYTATLVISNVIGFVNACFELAVLIFNAVGDLSGINEVNVFNKIDKVYNPWMIGAGIIQLKLEANFQPCRKYKFNILLNWLYTSMPW